jgi:hypothetical protein
MATVIHLDQVRDLRTMTPEGLWHQFVCAKAEIACVDSRLQQDGRLATFRPCSAR